MCRKGLLKEGRCWHGLSSEGVDSCSEAFSLRIGVLAKLVYCSNNPVLSHTPLFFRLWDP